MYVKGSVLIFGGNIRFIHQGVAETCKYSSETPTFYQNDLAMSNTAEVLFADWRSCRNTRLLCKRSRVRFPHSANICVHEHVFVLGLGVSMYSMYLCITYYT
jgi:hypothetical protein